MNVDRAISGSSVKRVSDDIIHLVDVDITADYLVQVWTLRIRQFSDRESTQSSGVEPGGLQPFCYLRLVHEPWNKIFMTLAKVFCQKGLEDVRKWAVPNVVKKRGQT